MLGKFEEHLNKCSMTGLSSFKHRGTSPISFTTLLQSDVMMPFLESIPRKQ